MWKYNQMVGRIDDPTGKTVGYGYAGHGPGRNNPKAQEIHNTGPLPKGIYTIIKPPIVHDEHMGYFVLRLEPDPGNEMFGRSGFAIHGDKVKDPGSASNGCIVADRNIREAIFDDEDDKIQVV